MEIQWFAKYYGSTETFKKGPFASEVEAWESLTGEHGDPVPDMIVWPIRVKISEEISKDTDQSSCAPYLRIPHKRTYSK